MHELTTTRHNELVDPVLQIWAWQIPVYLFIGGLVAGIMIISGYFALKGQYRKNVFSSFYLPHISLILLSLGTFSLFLDLEHKLYVWRLYTTFKITSPMSWGAWILVLVYPALWLNTLIRIPDTFKNRIPIFDRPAIESISIRFSLKALGLSTCCLALFLGCIRECFSARSGPVRSGTVQCSGWSFSFRVFHLRLHLSI